MCSVIANEKIRAVPLWAKAAASIIRRMPAGRYRLMHALCKDWNKTFVGKMPEQFGGYEFHCSFQDNIAREVFFTGYYEPQETAFVRAILQPGMSFVDAGSNWGFFTLMAAHLVGPSGRVIALEPDPRVFLKLKSNVERNHLENVKIFEVAAADRDSHLILAGHNEAEDNRGTSRLVESSAKAQIEFSVRSRPLDSLLDEAGVDRVDLIKIDVEGAEDLVLAGMGAGLNAHRYQRILLELHPLQLAERGRTMIQVMDLLKRKGYKGCSLDYSKAEFRRACYNPALHFSEFVRPLEQAMADTWPHTIWLSPDQPDLI